MVKIKYKDLGDMCIADADDMNVPVNSFLTQIDDSRILEANRLKRYKGWFEWSAQNFMPRKECLGGEYRVIAPERETILELVKKYVVPLYETALENLKTYGANYYWERKE